MSRPNPGSMNKNDMAALQSTIAMNEHATGLQRDLAVVRGESKATNYYRSYVARYEELLKLPALSEDDVRELEGHREVLQRVVDQKDVNEAAVAAAVRGYRLIEKQLRARTPEQIAEREKEIVWMKEQQELLKRKEKAHVAENVGEGQAAADKAEEGNI